MIRLLLLSVVVALITFPINAARNRDGRRGLKRAVIWVTAFSAFYAVTLGMMAAGYADKGDTWSQRDNGCW